MKKLKIILQHKYIIKIYAVIIIAFSLMYVNTYKYKMNYESRTLFIGTVYKKQIKSDRTILFIKEKEKFIINTYSNLEKINLGDKVKVTGNIKIIYNNTVPNTFNYQKYLYTNHIHNVILASKVEKIANNNSLIYYLKEKIDKRIMSLPLANDYIKIFILGDNQNLNEEIITSYRNNGISHLFSISGMHISLFVSILLYFLKRISYNNYYTYSIIIALLIIYVLIIGPLPSVIRSLTMYILFTINKLFNLKITKTNIILLVLIILLMINPYYLYNTSFQYSYLVSSFLILYNYKTKKIKSKFYKSLYISLIAFLASMPLSLFNNYQINVLSIFLNIILIPLVSIIIFPLSLISFIIPKVTYLLNIFIKILEFLSLLISKYNFGIIIFSKPSLLMIFIYYFFIMLFLYNSKYYYIFILLLCHKLNVYIDSSIKITVLDVGQGDSILLKHQYNKGNILIDTGGNLQSTYSISTNKIIPYLKSTGITKLDYLILTHGDYDHMGESINLVNNFKVEKVIFNCGSYNELESELIKVLDKKHIKYYSCIKELDIDKNKLYFLQTKEYDNENDNSNVIYTELDDYKFMLMGDASITTEKGIMNKYNLPDIDVLKVGHHGSRTSSSKNFINEIKPKYSVISVGKNNRYGHPNKEVLDNLENSKIYRTDKDGSVMFKIKNNKLKIETCNP